MPEYLIHNQYCYNYLIDQIPVSLLLYSHIPTALAAVIFGSVILFRVKSLSSVNLFIVCVAFALWCLFDLISWFAFLGSSLTMFTWSLLDLCALIMFLFSYYFLYSFVSGKDLTIYHKVFGAVLIAPVVVWTFLGSNLIGFDANICEAVEANFLTLYPYLVELVVLIATVVFLFKSYKNRTQKIERNKVKLAGIGVLTLLIFFFSSTFSVTLLVNYAVVEYAYNYEIYGLFGMPFLLGFLAFLVVRYHAFNIRLIGAQVLVVSLVFFVGSQFLFNEGVVANTLTGVTLLVTAFIGLNLVRSVKRVVEQREEIERQEKALEKTNSQLEIANRYLKDLNKQKTEFVSFASHQLRSPLTAIKGYASLILEGDYGPVSSDISGAVQVIFDSTKTLASVVDDYLNVTRIELGQIKYAFTRFDLSQLVNEIIKEQDPNIKKAKLSIKLNIEPGEYYLNGDRDKLKQVVSNLIDNAVKYTPQGSIDIELGIVDNHARLSVIDTGIGIPAGESEKLFAKFSRTSSANTTNTKGTGLGLYIAKEIINAHGGTIRAFSEGENKGSKFTIEIPIR